MTKTVTNFLLLSPAHLVSRIRHQHWCNLSLLSLYGFRVAKTPLFYLNHSTFESYFGCQFFYITVIFCFMSIHGKEKKLNLYDGIDVWQCYLCQWWIVPPCYLWEYDALLPVSFYQRDVDCIMKCYFTYHLYSFTWCKDCLNVVQRKAGYKIVLLWIKW